MSNRDPLSAHVPLSLLAPAMVLLTLIINYLALLASGVAYPVTLALLGAMLALLVGLFVSWWLTRELMKIVRGAERLARGEKVRALGVWAWGPLRALAQVFEDMATRIQFQKTELVKEVDAKEDGLKRHEEVLRMAADGIITVRGDHGTVRSFNQAAEKIFGRAAAEVEKRPIREALPLPPEHENFFADLAERLRAAPPDSRPTQELTGLRKDGTTFPMEVAASLARVNGREIVTVIVRDITERRRMEEDRKQAKQTLETRVHERTAELQRANAEVNLVNEQLRAAWA